MLNRRPAIFAIVLLLLIGGSLLHTMEYFAAFFFTNRMPSTSGFAAAFYAIWLPWSVAALACGVAGAYTILRRNSMTSHYLTAVGALLVPSLSVDRVQLNWSVFNLTAYLGIDAVKIGVNAAGVAFLIWLWTERVAEAGRRRSIHEHGAPLSPAA